MKTEIINGKTIRLAPNESKSPFPCPVCGGDLINNHGPGICIEFCFKCGYSDTDYD